MYLGWVVVVGCEPEVALVEVPDAQGLPTCHDDPLANVELLPEDNHRVLNVLLHDPDGVKLRSLYGSYDVLKLGVYSDAAAPGFATGFQNPSILSSYDRILIAQDGLKSI